MHRCRFSLAVDFSAHFQPAVYNEKFDCRLTESLVIRK